MVLRLALDGSMLVHETLTVSADSAHGTPYRDLPLASRDTASPVYDIDVMQVSRDGQRLPWRTTAVDGGLRLHLGSPARRIPPGTRTYEVLYHVDGLLAQSRDSEWLLWRPLGAGYAAAIPRLGITVTFPKIMDAESIRVQTAGGGRLASQVSRDGTVTLSSTAPLAAGEGPAILVGWPRGQLLTGTDSEHAPWMRPRTTSLWWGVVGLAALGVIVYRAARASAVRGALPALALATSLGTLYAAGAHATGEASAFAAEFALLLAAAAFAWLARPWLDGGGYGRVAYIVVVTALASFITVRWTVGISPWFPVLVIAHADALLWIARRVRAPAREHRRDARPSTTTNSSDSEPARARGVPVLDRHAPVPKRTEQLPDGRRIPRLDTLGAVASDGLGDASGLNPPRAAGRRRPGASAPPTGRARKY